MASYHLPNTPSISSVGEPNRLAMLKTSCRLCLEETEDFTSIHYTGNKFNTPPSIMIKSLIPEMYISVSLNPVICYNCLEELYNCYEFRLKCLRTENLIGTYLTETKNNSACIRLNDVIGYWKSKEQQKMCEKNELSRQRETTEDDCILLRNDEMHDEPTKVIQENTKSSSAPEKMQTKPMLKAIDISKLMDPNKKGMFGVDMSPQKSEPPRNISRSLLKPSVNPNSLEAMDMLVDFLAEGGTSRAGGAVVVKKTGQDQLSEDVGTQMKHVKIVMHNNKYTKIAPRPLTASLTNKPKTTLTNTEVPNNMEKLKKALEKAGAEIIPAKDITLKNILNRPDPNTTPPCILNSNFEPGQSVQKSTPTPKNSIIRLKPDSELKKTSTVRTLNHEISFLNRSLPSVDMEHETIPTSIIYKPDGLEKSNPVRDNSSRGQTQGIKTIHISPFRKEGQETGPYELSVVQDFTEIPARQTNEDVIDIKDEPLTASESLFGRIDLALDSQNERELSQLKTLFPQVFPIGNADSGESTRSASEISLMDRVLMDDDTDDEFCEDIPDYVQVKRVECFSNVKKGTTGKIVKKQKPPPSKPIPSQPPAKKRTRIRKRLKLVPVDSVQEKQTLKNKPDLEPSETATVVRQNVTPGRYAEKNEQLDRNVNKNAVVLFTSFTKNGDYINDHDYLVSPYVRNKIYYRTNNGLWLCCCVICDLLQSSEDHISHMTNHSTTCDICNIDFENVFVLNLHVKCHIRRCPGCHQTISYPMHGTHEKTCKSRPKEMTMARLRTILADQRSASASGSSRGQLPPEGYGNPLWLSQAGLVESLAPQAVFNEGENMEKEPSRKRYKSPSPEEEEACIYDKESKRFITPSMLKQKRKERKILSEDDIPLKLLIQSLKEKEALEAENRFIENIVKTHSDLRLGIPDDIVNADNQQTIENLSLMSLLENQPYVYVTKLDVDKKTKVRTDSEVSLTNKSFDFGDEDDSADPSNHTKTRDKFERRYPSRSRRNKRKFKSQSTVKSYETEMDIDSSKPNSHVYESAIKNVPETNLTRGTNNLTVDSQVGNSATILVNKIEIDQNLTDNSNGNQIVVGPEAAVIDLADESAIGKSLTDGDLAEVGHDVGRGAENILPKFRSTNTSKIEESHNEIESKLKTPDEDSSIKQAATDVETSTIEFVKTQEFGLQRAEMVENPFSTRRSVRLRTRNEFTPGIIAASLDWRTARKKTEPGKETQNFNATENPIEENPENTEKLVEENPENAEKSVEENPENAEKSFEETPDCAAKSDEKEDSQDLNAMSEKDSKSLKITILQNRLRKKLKKTKRAQTRPEDPQGATELKILEAEIQRIQRKIQKLKESPTKKKKIKKIPKELKEKLKEQKNIQDAESSILDSVNTYSAQIITEDENDASLPDKSNEDVEINSKIHPAVVKNLNPMVLTQPMQTNENLKNTSEEKLRKLSESLIDVYETPTEPIENEMDPVDSQNDDEHSSAGKSFEKLRGETMEELFQRLAQTAVETPSQPRTRKRTRMSEEFVTNIARKRVRKKFPTTNALEEKDDRKESAEISQELEYSEPKNYEQTVLKEKVDQEMPSELINIAQDLRNLEQSDITSDSGKIGEDLKDSGCTNSEQIVQNTDGKDNIADMKEKTVKSGKVVKKIKKRSKIIFSYGKGRKIGFGWAKKSRKKTSKTELAVKNVTCDIEKQREIPLGTTETVQDPYSFDTELSKMDETPLGFGFNQKTKKDEKLIKDKRSTINKELQESTGRKKKLKRNPAQMIKKVSIEREVLPVEESEEKSNTLEAILQTIMQVPNSPKVKTSRNVRKVLKKNPLNVKNRVKQVKKPMNKSENNTENLMESNLIPQQIPENLSTVDNVEKADHTEDNTIESTFKSSLGEYLKVDDNTSQSQNTERAKISNIKPTESRNSRRTSKTPKESSTLPEQVLENEKSSEFSIEPQNTVELPEMPVDLWPRAKEALTLTEKEIEIKNITELLSTESQIKDTSEEPQTTNENIVELSPIDSQKTVELPETSNILVKETRRPRRLLKTPKEVIKKQENTVTGIPNAEELSEVPNKVVPKSRISKRQSQKVNETSTESEIVNSILLESEKIVDLPETSKAIELPENNLETRKEYEDIVHDTTGTGTSKVKELSEMPKKLVRKSRISKRQSQKLSDTSLESETTKPILLESEKIIDLSGTSKTVELPENNLETRKEYEYVVQDTTGIETPKVEELSEIPEKLVRKSRISKRQSQKLNDTSLQSDTTNPILLESEKIVHLPGTSKTVELPENNLETRKEHENNVQDITDTRTPKVEELSEIPKQVVRKSRLSKRQSQKLNDTSLESETTNPIPLESEKIINLPGTSKSVELPENDLEIIRKEYEDNVQNNTVTRTPKGEEFSEIDKKVVRKSRISKRQSRKPNETSIESETINPIPLESEKMFVSPETSKVELSENELETQKECEDNVKNNKEICSCVMCDITVVSKTTDKIEPDNESETPKNSESEFLCLEDLLKTIMEPVVKKKPVVFKVRKQKLKTQQLQIKRAKKERRRPKNLKETLTNISLKEEESPQPSQILQEKQKPIKNKTSRAKIPCNKSKQVRKQVVVKKKLSDFDVETKTVSSDPEKVEPPKIEEHSKMPKHEMEVEPQNLEMCETERSVEIPENSKKNLDEIP